MTRPGRERIAPEYSRLYRRLKSISGEYGPGRLYADYVEIYDRTTNEISRQVLEFISEMSFGYGNVSRLIDKLFSLLYMMMLGEQNKAGTKLGKRINRLAVHQLLIEDWEPDAAADFSRGKPFTLIDSECRKRGI